LHGKRVASISFENPIFCFRLVRVRNQELGIVTGREMDKDRPLM
jgi:hypothetical protein